MALKQLLQRCATFLWLRSKHQSHNRDAWLFLTFRKSKKNSFWQSICGLFARFHPSLSEKGKRTHFGNPLGVHLKTNFVNYVNSTFPLASALRGHLTQEHITYNRLMDDAQIAGIPSLPPVTSHKASRQQAAARERTTRQRRKHETDACKVV